MHYFPRYMLSPLDYYSRSIMPNVSTQTAPPAAEVPAIKAEVNKSLVDTTVAEVKKFLEKSADTGVSQNKEVIEALGKFENAVNAEKREE